MPRRSVFLLIGLSALPAVAHAQAGYDRYGPSQGAASQPQPYAPAQGPGAAPTVLRGRMLSWPGKSAIQAVAPAAYAPSAYAPPQPAPAGYAPAYPRTGYGMQAPGAQRLAQPSPSLRPVAYTAPAPSPPSQDGWRPVYAPSASAPEPALAGAPTRPAAPTSIYAPRSYGPASYGSQGDAPQASNVRNYPGQSYAAQNYAAQSSRSQGYQPQPAPQDVAPQNPAPQPDSVAARVAAAPPPRGSAAQRYGYDPTTAHTVRFYSVSRPFGLQPDPAPIPPQFFTATADLADPPPQAPTERTSTTSSTGERTVHAAPDTSVN